MDPGSGEYYKIKHWVDAFMRIPFGKHQNLPITIDDGIARKMPGIYGKCQKNTR